MNERQKLCAISFLLRCRENQCTDSKTAFEENVPTITQIRKLEKKYTDGKVCSWSATSIRRILNNRFYLGEMAYGKSVCKSVGSKKTRALPKRRLENNSEPS